MKRLIPLIFAGLSGCVAMNLPKSPASYGDEKWVYPDPARMAFKIPDATQPLPEVRRNDGLSAWINDGQEDWKALKLFLKSIRGTP